MSNETNNEIPKNELSVCYKLENTEIKLTPTIVKNFITNGNAINVAEFKMFTELCKTQKLNPFLKEAYCVKYGKSPAQIVISKDVFMKRALLNPDFDGLESGVIIKDSQGKREFLDGTCYDSKNEELIGAWARVHRKNWKIPRMLTVALNECIQRKTDGSITQMWATKPAMMCEKTAKSRALKECFIDTLNFGANIFDESEVPIDISNEPEPIIEQPEPIIEQQPEVVVTTIDEEEINLDEL